MEFLGSERKASFREDRDGEIGVRRGIVVRQDISIELIDGHEKAEQAEAKR
jgi:hypothetical protein